MWGWRLAYAVGITPWEQAGVAGHEQLMSLVAGAQPDAPPGRALDIGCGSGAHAVALARLGWDVTGLDPVARALGRARQRAAAAGADVTWVQGLVEDLPALVRPGVRLVLDIGCFHALEEDARDTWARGVDAVSSPGGSVVVLAFSPGGRRAPGLPRGATADDIARRLRGWSVATHEAATTEGMPRALRSAAPAFVVLQKQPVSPYGRQPSASTAPRTSEPGS